MDQTDSDRHSAPTEDTQNILAWVVVAAGAVLALRLVYKILASIGVALGWFNEGKLFEDIAFGWIDGAVFVAVLGGGYALQCLARAIVQRALFRSKKR
jgi:hypothetical protein